MMLRRLKEDVEKNVPPKEETIIEVYRYRFMHQAVLLLFFILTGSVSKKSLFLPHYSKYANDQNIPFFKICQSGRTIGSCKESKIFLVQRCWNSCTGGGLGLSNWLKAFPEKRHFKHFF